MRVSLSNVTVKHNQAADIDDPLWFQTTTSSSVSASTTIPVASVNGVVAGAAIRGIGIRGSSKITVVSKSVASGAGNVIVSSAVTLEDGATLYFDGASAAIRVHGTINVKNMPIEDTTLYFNVERFLTCL